MYNNRKILAIIPARGGSKGIPHKNIISLNKKPLISYSVLAAKKSEYIDEVIVTTDDKGIAKVAKTYGAKVPFLRPKKYAKDKSKTIDAIMHCINWLKKHNQEYDILILLQPTQPLRTVKDIDNSIETFFKYKLKPLVSVAEVDDNPILIRSINNRYKLEKIINKNSTCRRQDMKKYYKINGCIYINLIKDINIETSFNDNIIPFIMDKSHSIDIDEINDLKIAEMYIKRIIK